MVEDELDYDYCSASKLYTTTFGCNIFSPDTLDTAGAVGGEHRVLADREEQAAID